MKMSLPLKLGIAVVVFFGLLLCGLFLWKPVRVRWYVVMLNSADAKERIEGVDGLIKIGAAGRDALGRNLAGGEAAAEFLIAFWAKPNEVVAQVKFGRYPLHIAAGFGYQTVAELLIAKGAEINAKGIWGRTPLHWTARSRYGQKTVAGLLLASGAEVNSKNAYGRTPLHEAALYGCKTVAEFLISKGAEVNAKDDDGETPLHLAAHNGRKAVAELLIARGAEVDAKADIVGLTPLHWAALYGCKTVVELLIAKGAEVNAKDSGGRTPLDFAIIRGQNEVADLLRSHGGVEGRGKK